MENFALSSVNYGRLDSQLLLASGIAVDANGNILVADSGNDRIQKFSPDFYCTSVFGSTGSSAGHFYWPAGVSVAPSGDVYVADQGNGRIQRFDANGAFIGAWGGWGHGLGFFWWPYGVSADDSGNVYVADTGNSRIQKFAADGSFLLTWGNLDGGEEALSWPSDVATDSQGYVYVADTWNSRLAKFTSEGLFVAGGGPIRASGIALDASGNVYATAIGEYQCVFKFSPEGSYITSFGGHGSEDGELRDPHGITVDSDGHVYVADTGNHRIQVFTTQGEFVTKFGEYGTEPGKLNSPMYVDVDAQGRAYVSDRDNHRVQVFKKTSVNENSKAIVVAGGGPFPGNQLWDATQVNANFAYRVLTLQGFTKQSIYYLTADTTLDLDNNGLPDDVDGDATNANLEQAISSWAADAETVVLYLVDHGGSGTFRMNGNETMEAATLGTLLDTLPALRTVVVYDACSSGSFLPQLASSDGGGRVVITSTSPAESAYFVTQGSVSFSSYFWTHILNGFPIGHAFSLAEEAMGYATAFQHPLLDANGNGVGNETEDLELSEDIYLGNGTGGQSSAPVIGAPPPDQTIDGTSTALLCADQVKDSDGVARVWAVIRPPNFSQGLSDNPVEGLPSVELMPVNEERYEGTYEGFHIAGTYQIAIYARDRMGNTCVPELATVTVVAPLRRKAVIVAGGWETAPMWPAEENIVLMAYEALRFQGYTDEDIYFLSPVTMSPGVDGSPTKNTLNYALGEWSSQSTQDVVFYLIGPANYGSFLLNQTEAISSEELRSRLDALQTSIPGRITVVYDACRSGSFLPQLGPSDGKERILLASAGENEQAHFLSGGDISFSNFFWRRVLNGSNLRDAFLHAKNAMLYSCAGQGARLDDNGNGIANEKADGQLARFFTIGSGIMLAGDDPMIGNVSPDQRLSSGTTTAAFWVEGVTSTGTLERVWAMITPPEARTPVSSEPVTDLPSVDLLPAGGGRYEGTYDGFSGFGMFNVSVLAMDTEGSISLPRVTHVIQGTGPDPYEEDDNFGQAGIIVPNDTAAQLHNFHDAGDRDWVKFYGLAGETYTARTSELGTSSDTVILLHDTDGVTLLASRDDGGTGEEEILDWACPADGVYFVEIGHSDPGVYGDNTEYRLTVYRPIGPLPGFVSGMVKDATSGQGLSGARVRTSLQVTALSEADGCYVMVHTAGTYTVTAEKEGYTNSAQSVTVKEAGLVTADLSMQPQAQLWTAGTPALAAEPKASSLSRSIRVNALAMLLFPFLCVAIGRSRRSERRRMAGPVR